MVHDDADRGAPVGGSTRDEVAAILRRPRRMAMVAGLTTLGMALVLVRLDRFVAGPLIVGTPAALVCMVNVWQALRFTPASITRLEGFAQRVGGRFTPLARGAGGCTATIFREGAQLRRFGVLDYAPQGTRIEIGHLLSSSHADARSMERRHAYAVLDLPARMPHMVLDFGHLRRFLGVRVAPEHWHRAQLVDVGGGRRFRLFVAAGGEHVARTFFTPATVRAFEEIGRHYDVEIHGSRLHLFSSRSAASGSDRRWERQRALIEGLATSVAQSPVWDSGRRPGEAAGLRPETWSWTSAAESGSSSPCQLQPASCSWRLRFTHARRGG